MNGSKCICDTILMVIFTVLLQTCQGHKYNPYTGMEDGEMDRPHWGFRFHPGVIQSRSMSIPRQTVPIEKVLDLNCFVCEEEEDHSCREENTPVKFLKSCKATINILSIAFDPSSGIEPSFLCYKKYNPYTKMISRSCQTTTNLPEWFGISGCTTSRFVNPSGKIGTRCICNTTACNGESIYVPQNSSNDKHCPANAIFSCLLFVIYTVF